MLIVSSVVFCSWFIAGPAVVCQVLSIGLRRIPVVLCGRLLTDSRMLTDMGTCLVLWSFANSHC